MRATTILLALTIFSIALTSSGCGNAEFRLNEGAVLKEGILKGGIQPKLEVQPGAFPEPLLKVEKGAVEIQEGAFKGPAINVQPEAVKFVMESGAINIHEGAINVNLIGKKKAPYIETEEIRKALKGLKPLGKLDGVPEAVKANVVNNEKVMQSVIKAILDAVDEHNRKYAEPPKEKEDEDK